MTKRSKKIASRPVEFGIFIDFKRNPQGPDQD